MKKTSKVLFLTGFLVFVVSGCSTVVPQKISGASTAADSKVVILEEIIVLDDTHFEYDSSNLTKAGEEAVIQNMQVLKENPEVKIRIAGYASAIGTIEYNQKLSERRAKAVEKFLVKNGGIDLKRLTTIGYGNTRPAMYEPIPENIESKQARANMRVLFEIIVK